MENEQNLASHGKMIMASYGWGKALQEFIAMAFGALGFFYYETEIGLNVWLTSIGYIMFAIWNAINDPLVGYLTNRPFKFTKKWGRRFPWIVMGGIPWILSYILIFTPPNVDPESGGIWIFLWLVLTTCIFDTFNSVWWIGFSSLFPDKFRTIKERRTVQAIATPIGIIGITLGALIPPLLITYGNKESYLIQAGIMILLGLIIFVISIPGCRDDEFAVEKYLNSYEEGSERISFISMLKISLKQKSFVIYIITYTLFQALVYLIQASVPYVVRYILKMPASAQTLPSAGFLIGAIISSPFWIQLAHKTNDNRKTMIIAGIALTIFTAPLIFIDDYLLLFFGMLLFGIGLGGFWALLTPVLADVIDESVVITGKREEGIYTGFQAFFGRFAIVMQAVTFAIVHTLTEFQEGATTQTVNAIWGIHIHFGFVPMLFMLLGTLIFWRWYPLTPSKIDENLEIIKIKGL